MAHARAWLARGADPLPALIAQAAVDAVQPDVVIARAAELGYSIVALLTTHQHWDHAGGNKVPAACAALRCASRAPAHRGPRRSSCPRWRCRAMAARATACPA